MRLITIISTLCMVFPLALSGAPNSTEKKSPVDYVNPYMGNISHLLIPTYPTVHLPNSMLRVCPERGDFTSDMIHGLPVATTSHRGSSAFRISPVQGDYYPEEVINYSYDSEKLTPYTYSVYLDEVDINVNYAPSYQAGIYQISFEKEGDNHIIIHSRDGLLKVTPDGISGYQIIDGTPTRIFLYLETEQRYKKAGALINGSLNDKQKQGKSLIISFGAQEKIHLRYGISFISEEQAKKNLERDIRTYDVQTVASQGKKIWNKKLGKITVEGGTENDKSVFYTSLYRTYERMINISEDGRYYSAFDCKVHDDNGIPFYTDDWIWDTYRATHPLRVLIEPEIECDMISSYIRMAEQTPQGWVPTFPEVTGDSHRMNGNHAIAVIWDAYSKGLTNFSLERAYEACQKTIMEKTLLPWQKLPLTELDKFYHKNGFFPALHPGEAETCQEVHNGEKRQAVAVTLGDCYDKWCLAQTAKSLHKEQDYKLYLKDSYAYRNLYNHATGFFHPKDINGNFIEPFDYRFSGGQGCRDYYGENNGWIYRWDVQHNPADLISLMGGNENFIRNLNQTFREPLGRNRYDFYQQLPDHTGNVGQFSMANEPCLHIPYLYNYAGQPWMAQKRIRKLLNQWFRNDLMGVPGDEDGGGMSAFVVFSMMGFYPVTPGIPAYNIGSPVFKKVKIDIGNNGYFEIIARNYSPDNIYIQSATLNGKVWDKPWFGQEDIKDGGQLILTMGNRANKNWGSNSGSIPPSAEKYD